MTQWYSILIVLEISCKQAAHIKYKISWNLIWFLLFLGELNILCSPSPPQLHGIVCYDFLFITTLFLSKLDPSPLHAFSYPF